MNKVKQIYVLEITESILKQVDASKGMPVDLILIPISLKEKWLKSDLRIASLPCLHRSEARKGNKEIYFIEELK